MKSAERETLREFSNSPFLQLLRQQMGPRWRHMLLIAAASGLSDGAVVFIVNTASRAEDRSDPSLYYFALFIVATCSFFYTRRYLLIEACQTVERLISHIRLRVTDHIRHMDLVGFDDLGQARINMVLSQEASILSAAALPVFNAFGAMVMLVFCCIYLGVLSRSALLIVVVMVIFSVRHYLKTKTKIQENLDEAVQRENGFFSGLREMLLGFKEVKMNQARNDDLYENYISDSCLASYALKTEANGLFVSNFIFAQFFFYLQIAAVVFVLPQFEGVTSQEVTELTAVILFSIGPLSEVVSALPMFAKANVAVRNIEALEATISTPESNAESPAWRRLAAVKAPKELCLEQVRFSYRGPRNEELFSVGPADLVVKKGELVFLVGGNGSGKSTLLKALSGLYPLESGCLRLNGVEINEDNRALFREYISAIFADFHLFDRLYGLEDVDAEYVDQLLDEMGLSEKTGFADNTFTNIRLSTGQRKRLALITALLEERPICVLDEVAADQDPDFKKYFYEVILKQMKKRGKILIVVSHDDHYFHVADRVYRMDYGQLSDWEPVAPRRPRRPRSQ